MFTVYRKLLNNKGNISLIAMLLFTLLTLLIVCSLTIHLKKYNALKERSETYLCFKYQITEVKKLIKTVARYNKVILLLQSTKLIPEMALIARSLIIAAQLKQRFSQAVYYKRIISNKYCKSKLSGASFLLPHYSTKRSLFGLLKILSKKRTYIIKGKNSWTLILKATLSVKNHLDRSITIKSTEIFPFLGS